MVCCWCTIGSLVLKNGSMSNKNHHVTANKLKAMLILILCITIVIGDNNKSSTVTLDTKDHQCYFTETSREIKYKTIFVVDNEAFICGISRTNWKISTCHKININQDNQHICNSD
jgi:hypothetical protein